MAAWSTLQWYSIQLVMLFLMDYPKYVVNQLSRDPEELLNWCLDGQNHKEQPGPEDQLHSHCVPWTNHSCCTTNTTQWIHQPDFNMYNFNWDHCADTKPMSESCHNAFVKDLCFYECEPHLGAWGVKDKKKMRKERFENVPVCATDCDIWYSSCKEDFTCVSNWAKNFTWKGGINICPANSACRPFSEVFGDSKTFCENVSVLNEPYRFRSGSCDSITVVGRIVGLGRIFQIHAGRRAVHAFVVQRFHGKPE